MAQRWGLIVPLWNRYVREIVMFCVMIGFNRTFMELKFIKDDRLFTVVGEV